LDHAGCEWLYQTIADHLNNGGAVILSAHDNKKIHQLANHHITLQAPASEDEILVDEHEAHVI
jgi:ABC-type transport system involved in cytochrome c biogenesis ATPase subunit